MENGVWCLFSFNLGTTATTATTLLDSVLHRPSPQYVAALVVLFVFVVVDIYNLSFDFLSSIRIY